MPKLIKETHIPTKTPKLKSDAPEDFDWRSRGKVGPIYNQG